MLGAGGGVVYLHVGQCGNQVGDAFWQLADAQCAPPSAASSATKSRRSRQLRGQFFHDAASTARCILVDTEPKVVRAVQRRLKAAHAHTEHAGRGNNWAMGYNFQQHRRNVVPSKTMAPTTAEHRRALRRGHHGTLAADDLANDRRELVELVMESLRVEIEALDRYDGSMVMHSLGGGTGAGLGCRLLETMRDTYPRAYLTTVSIAPSRQSGDTPLQNYNALFTLQHLQSHADCVVFKENDELLRAATRWKALRSKTADTRTSGALNGAESPEYQHARVSVQELNWLVASDVAGLVFPLVSSTKEGAKGVDIVTPFKMGQLVHDCCPMPATKFVDVRTGVLRDSSSKLRTNESKSLFHALNPKTPASGDSSDALDSNAAVMRLIRHTTHGLPRQHALAAAAVIRGFEPETKHRRQLEDSLTAALPTAEWSQPIAVAYSSAPSFPSLGAGGSVSLCVNNGHVRASANHFLDRARRQFDAKAYVHWYRQHGLEDDDFVTAFESSEQLIAAYDELLA
ncbi:hypothetical protein PINS_up008047 [Pythium insidiosum]|nr:hypothetical protein PINS_up008047 [Pythium insidiosum]